MTSTPNSNKFEFDKAKDLVEVVGKVALGVVALCYAMGLVVVSFHLNKYGVYSISLLRLNYVSAGLWALVPFILIAFIVWTVVTLIPPLNLALNRWLTPTFDSPDAVHKPPFPAALLYVWSLFSIGLLLVNNLFVLRVRISWSWALPLFYALMVVVYTAITIRALAAKYRVTGLFCGMITLVVFQSYLLLFANNLYGTIPSHLGGGGLKKIQMVLEVEPENKLYLESLGIGFVPSLDSDSKMKAFRTGDVYLIFVTDTEYSVVVGDTAITIPHDIVKTVIYNYSIRGTGGSY